MSQLQAKLANDSWVKATWNEYIKVSNEPTYEKAKGYYFKGRMRNVLTRSDRLLVDFHQSDRIFNNIPETLCSISRQ